MSGQFFEIKSRYNASVLFSMECGSLRICVEAAVKANANLGGAYLACADLAGAYLARADLAGADLARANLTAAYLAGANLSGADLARADLAGANLGGADLARANLARANLARAYLARADLARANLAGANLACAREADYAIACTRILPEGDLIVWKNCDRIIVKLKIPEAAKRSHAFGRKCRAEYAIDMGHWDAHGNALPLEHKAFTDQTAQCGSKATYRYGEKIVADSWDEDFTNECSHGIHFFLTRLEAENWK
jgi:hypothetical protein